MVAKLEMDWDQTYMDSHKLAWDILILTAISHFHRTSTD